MSDPWLENWMMQILYIRRHASLYSEDTEILTQSTAESRECRLLTLASVCLTTTIGGFLTSCKIPTFCACLRYTEQFCITVFVALCGLLSLFFYDIVLAYMLKENPRIAPRCRGSSWLPRELVRTLAGSCMLVCFNCATSWAADVLWNSLSLNAVIDSVY